MTPRNAERGPRQARAAIDAPATKQEHQQGTAVHGVVHVVERLLSATFHVPTPAATRLLRRTATATGCEQEPGGSGWIVYGTRVERVVSALEAAGYVVERTDTSTPDATVASTS